MLSDYIDLGVFVVMLDHLPVDDTSDVPGGRRSPHDQDIEGSFMAGFFVDNLSNAEMQKLQMKQRLVG